MTALTEFQRLEAAGNWRSAPDERAREVIVSVGDATLVLSDPKSETPLSHWSLPAVTRLNPGEMPALYGPGSAGADERLEIDDALMISAIERVHRAIAQRRAHPGRLRGGLMALGVAAMVVAAVAWLPGALVRHAARIAPPAQRAALGTMVLAEIERSSGAACRRRGGETVLNHLAPRLLGTGATVAVVPATLPEALRLPGNLFVIGSNLLADPTGPEVLAGHLLATSVATGDAEATRAALERAGPRAALQLLTAGRLPSNALAGYGEALLSRQPARASDGPLLDAFEAAGVPSAPYARAIDPSGESVLALIEGDPFRTGTAPLPLLTDQQWVALQEICRE